MPKRELRALMRERRRALTEAERHGASVSVSFQLLRDPRVRGVVAVYLASPRELDLAPFLKEAPRRGLRLAAPRWNGSGYDLAELRPPLREGPMGIAEPAAARLVPPEAVNVWLVPGLAFTLDGARLGYGGGWYDRLLARAKTGSLKLGVGFAVQLIEALPVEDHDVRLDGVVIPYTGRLAPSPTGALHLGNVRTFMIAWLRARAAGGRLVMRMEDLDHPKDKPGAAAAALEDLRWLGFDWDGEFVQSERRGIYREALSGLVGKDLVYPCVCSRRDVEAAQSAPHDGEQLRYPGTCRGRFRTWEEALRFRRQTPCWRFRVDEGTGVSFTDTFAGAYSQDVFAVLGDFPLARDRDGAGYTFAATVDDLLMGVTEVVRGDDLLPATPAQLLLARALASCTPRTLSYFHVPLVVGEDGRRLAKRHGDTRVGFYRERGIAPGRVLGFLAESCGWAEKGESVSLAGLLERFDPATIPHKPFVVRPGDLI